MSYIIKDNNTPNQTEPDIWEENELLAVPLDGRLYKQDNLTVHNIILRNTNDTSYAFTYVKPYIKKYDVRTDIKLLHSRYENVVMQEQYVSESKCTTDTIQYRNERAMTFEKLFRKLLKAVEKLEKIGRGMHNADIVEIIWQGVSNSELGQHLTDLKV